MKMLWKPPGMSGSWIRATSRTVDGSGSPVTSQVPAVVPSHGANVTGSGGSAGGSQLQSAICGPNGGPAGEPGGPSDGGAEDDVVEGEFRQV